MLFTGLANINLWYPWRFNFPDTHYRTAWIVMGALVVHIGAKISTTRRALRAPPNVPRRRSRAERRRFLATAFGVERARHGRSPSARRSGRSPRLALLAPRRPDVGPQGFPVNATAKETGVVDLAQSPSYRLVVTGKVARPLTFTVDELRALPQHSATLADHVRRRLEHERSAGPAIRVRDLLAMAGAAPHARARRRVVPAVRELPDVANSTTGQAHDPDTLLALAGERRAARARPRIPAAGSSHPNRPGVMQTKWVKTLIVL